MVGAALVTMETWAKPVPYLDVAERRNVYVAPSCMAEGRMTVEKAVLATIVVGVINADVTSNAVSGVDQVDTTCVVPVGLVLPVGLVMPVMPVVPPRGITVATRTTREDGSTLACSEITRNCTVGASPDNTSMVKKVTVGRHQVHQSSISKETIGRQTPFC